MNSIASAGYYIRNASSPSLIDVMEFIESY